MSKTNEVHYFRVICNDSPDRFVIKIDGHIEKTAERWDNNFEVLSEAVSQDLLEYEIANNCSFYVNEIDQATYEAEK